jgi:DNA-binding response OmpR family regulator
MPSMKKTILVVDDDDVVRESVNKVLQAAGYETVIASGGLEAIMRCHIQPIDLVLLDLGLPNQNGWETCQLLAREHSSTPIIIMTGQEGQHKTALRAGAEVLLKKPLDAQQLLRVIERIVGRSASLEHAAHQLRADEDTQPGRPVPLHAIE